MLIYIYIYIYTCIRARTKDGNNIQCFISKNKPRFKSLHIGYSIECLQNWIVALYQVLVLFLLLFLLGFSNAGLTDTV